MPAFVKMADEKGIDIIAVGESPTKESHLEEQESQRPGVQRNAKGFLQVMIAPKTCAYHK